MRLRVILLRRLVAVLLLTGMSVLALSMFAGTFPEKEVTRGESPARRLIAERVKHLELLAKERSKSFDEELDLNYVSRRRIPTGPDPIHNRYSHHVFQIINTQHAPSSEEAEVVLVTVRVSCLHLWLESVDCLILDPTMEFNNFFKRCSQYRKAHMSVHSSTRSEMVAFGTFLYRYVPSGESSG